MSLSAAFEGCLEGGEGQLRARTVMLASWRSPATSTVHAPVPPDAMRVGAGLRLRRLYVADGRRQAVAVAGARLPAEALEAAGAARGVVPPTAGIEGASAHHVSTSSRMLRAHRTSLRAASSSLRIRVRNALDQDATAGSWPSLGGGPGGRRDAHRGAAPALAPAHRRCERLMIGPEVLVTLPDGTEVRREDVVDPWP